MYDFDHIAVIDPATRIPEIDCFNNIAEMTDLRCTYHLPDLGGASSLLKEDPEHIKAIFVLGGSGCLDSPLEWRLQLEKWFQKCLDKKVPTMGFCWGHQWIASLHGGEVGLVPKVDEKIRGFREITVDECLPLKASKGDVVVSHREMVLKAPSEAKPYVKSDFLENEGFIYNDNTVFTFQHHPEATNHFLHNNTIPHDGSEDLSYGNSQVKQFIDWSVSL